MKTPLREFALAMLLAALPATSLLGAVDPSEWPRQLPFAVARAGLTRVELGTEVLASTRADRGDLRILDPDGREVPWRLHRAIAAEPPRATIDPGPVAARIADRQSVLEFDTRTDRALSGLRLVTTATGFFKAATLEGQRNGIWERLASGVPLYQDYQGATEVRLDFARGTWTRMRLVLDDRRSPPIPVRSIVLLAGPATPVPVSAAPAVIRSRSEEPGITRLQLDLGAAGLDVAWIELETPEPLFTRPVRILAERVAGDALVTEELVRAFVHRIPGDDTTAEGNRRIRVERPIPTREIVVLIENGDSPPLASPALRVGLHAQRIEFWATREGQHRLLAGNAFAAAPRYDISRLALPADITPEAIVAAGPWSATPGYREPAVGPDALGRGAAFEPKGWRHHRALTAPTGTAELELPGDVLAASRDDLADIRIVQSGRQVAYVADRQTLRRALPLTTTAEPARPKSRASAWRLVSAAPGVPMAVVRIDTPQTAFARSARWLEVVETRDGTRLTNVLARAEWLRGPGTPPRPLELVPGSRPAGTTTWIEIDDGDNPPLPSLTAKAEYTTRRLHFLAAGSERMELHYGNPEATAPRYDLALLADRLNASSRTTATLGPAEERRPGWGETVVSGTAMQAVFWGVLAGVVIALFAVIRRLLPAPPGGSR